MEARRAHGATIEQALRKDFPALNRVDVIGSHTRRTAIRNFSDVDYLAVHGRDDLRRGGSLVTSTTALEWTKKALEARLPHTAIRISGPAVVVEFDGGEGAVDVVPGYFEGVVAEGDGYPRFGIADGEGDWLLTNPQRHGKYLADENRRACHRVAPIIRLLKAWKYSRQPAIPLLGFHLELLLASQSACTGPRSYGRCLLTAFKLLREREGKALNDPLGVSPRILAVSASVQAERLVEHAQRAAEWAALAVAAEREGDVTGARRYWSDVFNDEFPAS